MCVPVCPSHGSIGDAYSIVGDLRRKARIQLDNFVAYVGRRELRTKVRSPARVERRMSSMSQWGVRVAAVSSAQRTHVALNVTNIWIMLRIARALVNNIIRLCLLKCATLRNLFALWNKNSFHKLLNHKIIFYSKW